MVVEKYKIDLRFLILCVFVFHFIQNATATLKTFKIFLFSQESVKTEQL